MKTSRHKYTLAKAKKRYLSTVLVLLLLAASVFPVISSHIAHAYSNVTSRSIEMSSSANAATGVTYQIQFTTATALSASNADTLVVNFCSTDPILDDNCGASTGSPPSSTAVPSITSTAGFTISYTSCASNCSWSASTSFPSPAPTPGAGCSSTGYNNSTLFLNNAGTNVDGGGHTIAAGTVVTINLPGDVTNPATSNTSFYARIFTFNANAQTNATANNNYCPDGNSSLNNIADAGGIALSTANQITITAKVQEELTFCVYTSAFDSGACSGTGSTVSLGDTHGVLSSGGPFVDRNTKYDVQTNAAHGAIIRMTGNTLTSGSATIEATSCSGTSTTACPGGASTNAASTPGSPQFGLCTWASGGTTANLTPSSPYSDAGCSSTSQTAGTGSSGGDGGAKFGFNITNSTSTFGDTLATAVAGAYATGTIAFIGNISNTTLAGIYTTTLTFIATSTY